MEEIWVIAMVIKMDTIRVIYIQTVMEQIKAMIMEIIMEII
jgi:hypothetical protein